MREIADFVISLMAGGTMEIVLLVVIIIVALILFLIALWVLWKVIGLLGKGLLWLIDFGSGQVRSRSAAHKEAQRSRLPPVSTNWGRSGRVGLRIALAGARRLIAPDALCIVVVAGEGGAGDLCRSLGLTPPPVASISLAAGGQTLLIDATRASRRELRKLARALPWSRPVDGVAILANADGLPPESIARVADFAREIGMRVALHLVLPSRGAVPAWRIIDAHNSDGGAICSQLAADTVRIWLAGGDREGLQELALAQARELPGSINRALSAVPSSLVDVASLGFSGVGLRGAVAQTVDRTRPTAATGIATGLSYAAVVVGVALSALTIVLVTERADMMHETVAIAKREAIVPWTDQEIDAIPNRTKVHRLAGIGNSLSEYSSFSPLAPLASLAPKHLAPRRLGKAFLDSYLLRPLGAALENQAKVLLVPTEEAGDWLDNARVINDWMAAWEALGDDPREVDVKALLAAAFGGGREDWPDDLDIAIMETGVALPLPSEGGFDIAATTELARENFALSMGMWAHSRYTNGPVATVARRVGDTSAGWRSQHAALLELRAALQDPGQQWLTAAADRSDHAAELRLLGQALALGLVGQVSTVEAKANIARIRIDARGQISQFILPGMGAILDRSSQGSTTSLQLSKDAAAWLRYLDKVANAGFSVPLSHSGPPVHGVVTIDAASVARSREKLRAFDRFSSDLPADLPASLARDLLAELASELVLGIVIEVENALRADSNLGLASSRAERRASSSVALKELAEIEGWLSDRQALAQADRVRKVQARIADGVLTAAAEALDEEDPLGIHLDPTADSNALLRRLDRGLLRLRSIFEQFVQPFLPVATDGGNNWVVLHWQNIASDLAAYARGDADSALSALEGNLRAWAEDSGSVCGAPRSPIVERGDYLARAMEQTRSEIESACEAMRLAEIERRVEDVREYYDTHMKEFWPFSANAPEVGSAALVQFVEKLHANAEILSETEGQLAADFVRHASFWMPGQGASVQFKIEWRWRDHFDFLAHHVAEVRMEGVEADDNGVYTWHYGEPFSVHFRLAKDSPYRFRLPDGRLAQEWAVAPDGRGALLRVLEGMVKGEWTYETELLDQDSNVHVLRYSARVIHDDERPMTVPTFGNGSG